MSGHSHYATIKRQKESNDAQKGQLFSKLAYEIAVATKVGKSGDIDTNYKLRVAVDRARAANMPKDNIERAITKALGTGGTFDEVTYEGYGPQGIAVIIEAATNNRNRTAQEIKNIFERGGGNLAGPGAVSFNFEPRGLITAKKESNPEEQMLKLIESGAEDMQEIEDEIEVYVAPSKLSDVRKKLEENGSKVTSFELIQKPKNLQTVSDVSEVKKILGFLDNLNDHPDVLKVFANLDIPEEVIKQIS